MKDVAVCVGTSVGATEPTWFYVFDMYDKASNFVAWARNRTFEVSWEIYPCPVDQVGTAAMAFDVALRAFGSVSKQEAA